MFVVLSKFTVAKVGNMAAAVKKAFIERPHMVEDASGFLRLDVLTPLENPDEIWLFTYWNDRDSFHRWYGTHPYKIAHQGIPEGLKLAPDRTEMRFFEYITS